MNNTQTQNWLQIIDVNVAHGTKQQRLDLLQKIVATDDRILLARYLVELMVYEDKQEIINGDLDFLDSVLRGDGWIGYSQLSIEQNIIEFISRECTHKLFFYSDDPQFQHLLANLNQTFITE
ncbi:MAG: hypothetical protein KME09_04595 [Pleurocapsa minor HA4230-MV1]|jgi:hypothetical protein|nr:hypothetical protein [Pleurocapsa minor HA4230-MV1]